MIEQRDLDAAVGAGIVDAATAARLVDFTRDYRRGVAGPDEEAFRLLTGFNDIFVTIAIGLVISAIFALGWREHTVVCNVVVAFISWGFAEYFTRKKRMALPSIVLLITFVASVGFAVMALFGDYTVGDAADKARTYGRLPWVLPLSGVAAVVAAYAHWRRFMVPITVAAGAAALGLAVVGTMAAALGPQTNLLLAFTLIAGLATFALAMAFDSRDRARVTRWSDVAFWLHLLAAPMIVHPVFALAGLLHGNPAPGAAVAVILVYAGLTLVALAIDRRALLVSALAYVIYAIQSLVSAGGALDTSLALTALVIGGFLVLLSAAWRPIRGRVVALLPAQVSARLPMAAI